MTDFKNENDADNSGLNEKVPAAPKPTLRLAATPPHNPQSNPSTSEPKVRLAPKPVAAPKPTLDPSVSIDNDSNMNPPVALLIVDALAAAVALAFSVLLVQDTLPFLK